jgi:methyl-accepting chemotaxis protein/methyl-accepting chemotaxis protein-1 (serine sensor receptor)
MIHDSGADMEMLVVGIERREAGVVSENIEEVNSQIDETLALVEDIDKDADARLHQLDGALKTALTDWKAAFAKLAARGTAMDLAGARAELEATKATGEKASVAAAAILENRSTETKALEAASEVTFANARNLQFVLIALLLLIGGAAIVMVRGIVRTLSTVATELQLSSSEVAAASGHVATTAQSLSQGAISQAASIEETSASMEEMASMTRQNADNSAEAARLMAEAGSAVDRSNTVLREMVESMQSIRESSDKVSRIIKTIDEIAFQTNILALNAAVEAARAGEAGMGFAVVADEVRSLAQRSAQAARDTAVLIEESINNAQRGGERVVHVEQAISGITESVTRVKSLVDQVSEASREQSQGIDQVSGAISRMENVTQTTAASAEESAAASEELSAQAESVLSSVRTLEQLVTGGRGGQAAYAAPAPAPVSTPRKSVAMPAARKPAPRHVSAPAPASSSGADLIPFEEDAGFVPFDASAGHGRKATNRAA